MMHIHLSAPSAAQLPSLHTQEEQLTYVKRRLMGALLPLAHPNSGKKYRWCGSSTDLIELIYLIYREQLLTDKHGYPLPLKALTTLFCTRLQVHIPHNPTQTALRAQARKGYKRASLIERYRRLMFDEGCTAPLQHELSCLDNEA